MNVCFGKFFQFLSLPVYGGLFLCAKVLQAAPAFDFIGMVKITANEFKYPAVLWEPVNGFGTGRAGSYKCPEVLLKTHVVNKHFSWQVFDQKGVQQLQVQLDDEIQLCRVQPQFGDDDKRIIDQVKKKAVLGISTAFS